MSCRCFHALRSEIQLITLLPQRKKESTIYATEYKKVIILEWNKFVCYTVFYSAYEVKYNCCLSERLFKIKNGIFLFEVPSFVSRYSYIFVLCKWGKWWCHKQDISRNIGAAFFKLGTRNAQCTSQKIQNDTQRAIRY